jgi:hypothetical protein
VKLVVFVCEPLVCLLGYRIGRRLHFGGLPFALSQLEMFLLLRTDEMKVAFRLTRLRSSEKSAAEVMPRHKTRTSRSSLTNFILSHTPMKGSP